MKSYTKNGWLYISVSGTPHEIGYSYGTAIVEEMVKIQKMVRFHIFESMGVEWDYFITVAKRLFTPYIYRHYREYYEEMMYMVKGINDSGGSITMDEMVAWNNYFTITIDWYNSKYKKIYQFQYNFCF